MGAILCVHKHTGTSLLTLPDWPLVILTEYTHTDRREKEMKRRRERARDEQAQHHTFNTRRLVRSTAVGSGEQVSVRVCVCAIYDLFDV